MYKILVPIKRVPDYQIKVKIAQGGANIVTDGIKWIINPFDEIAVEEALRIKEKFKEVEITVCTIGPSTSTEQLRTALGMGADKAVLVTTEDYIDSDSASRILAAVFQKETYQLVIMGKQSIDSDANQTGQLLASRLKLPQATFASKLELSDSWSDASVTREIDGGLETIKVMLPAVITTDLRLNQPRLAPLMGIVKAKTKPLEEIPIANLGIDFTPKVKIKKMELPPTRKAGIKVSSVQELVEKLQKEAKVI
jgi:electron transfer flavoprotein beta subunit